MKNESLWSAIKAGFPVGAVFFGALVGPAMVTGSYTINYFLCSGVKGWIILLHIRRGNRLVFLHGL